MNREPATAELSCDEIHLNTHKKVRWALNLEEILYFAPDTECNAPNSMLKKMKTKACALKSNQLSGLLEICDRNRLHKLQEKFKRLVEKLRPDCDELPVEDFYSSNKYWDDLFELYGEYKPAFEK